MLKKLIIIITISFVIIALSNLAWSSVEGTWEMTGKVSTSIKAKGMKSKTLKGTLDGDSWIFNDDNSFESDNVGGTWSQTKTKFAVNFNDDDVISLTEEMLSEEFGTDLTVNAITKKTFSGTENTKKGTIKGSFKIYMTASGYDESCGCERTGNVTVSGSFTGGKESTEFPGTWKCTSVIDGKQQQITLTLDITLKGTLVSVVSSSGLTYTAIISGMETNGILYFDLPVSDQGNPDCVNWDMSCSATQSQNYTVMNLSCSGTACGSGGGQPMSFTWTLIKQ
jgi:hypothetical protein